MCTNRTEPAPNPQTPLAGGITWCRRPHTNANMIPKRTVTTVLALFVLPGVVMAQDKKTRGEYEHPKPVYTTIQPNEPWPPVATFSILGYDPETGEVGGAVQSRVFSVGNGVLWAEAGVGAAATQAIVDVSYGPQAISLLRTGMAPSDIIKQIWDKDPDPDPVNWSKQGRQFAVMDAKGNYAAFTGPKATDWAGNKSGKFCTAQGNILAGGAVVDSMVAAFERTKGRLALRLVAALEAGQLAGGDKRGMQSAALLIVKKDGGVWVHNDVVARLQVDDNPEPIKELRRLVEKSPASRPPRPPR